MTETHCKNCNKLKIAGRAGSITSYFFQHNYCRCGLVNDSGARVIGKKPSVVDINTCSNCGKVQAENKRAGSFSAFLFSELRCTCGGKPLAKVKKPFAPNATVRQTAERKQFTANLRKTSFQNQENSTRLLSVGANVSGFRIMSVIGQGGMGAVYLAQHAGLRRAFALKVLLPSLVNENNWQRFKAEAKTVAALNHPTLVKVYDLGVHENSLPFYSMDYIAGITLEDFLIEEGALSIEQAVQIFTQVLDGLAYAHRNGIVHRDIKPANIMLGDTDNFDVIKILDFGIAKLLDSSAANQGLTMAGEVFGSPYYMSPEQSESSQVDARSDIYSVGCSLFETLTLNVPFDAESSIEILSMHQASQPPRLNDFSRRAKFSDSLECVIAKCLAKLPDDRYQNAKELALDLARISEGKDLSSYQHLAKQFSNLSKDRGIASKSPEGYREGVEGARNKKLFDQGSSRLVLIFVMVIVPVIVVGTYLIFASVKSDRDFSKKVQSADKNYHLSVDSQTSNPMPDPGFDSLPTSAIDEKIAKQIEAYLKDKTTPYAAHPANAIKGKKYFDFPSTFSLGLIQFVRVGVPSPAVQATGKIMAPADSRIDFIVDQNVAEYPQLLKLFEADDLYSIYMRVHPGKGSPPKLIQHLTGLVAIDFGFCEMTNADVPLLAKFLKLRALELRENNLSSKVVAQCAVLSQLSNLSLGLMDDLTPVFTVLARAKRIKSLKLCGNLKSGEIALLPELTTLQSLTITYIDPTVAACKQLTQIRNLTSLDLGNSALDANKLKILSKLNHLKGLSFGTIDGDPDEIIAQLKLFQNLKELGISNSSDVLLEKIAKALPQVKMAKATPRFNMID